MKPAVALIAVISKMMQNFGFLRIELENAMVSSISNSWKILDLTLHPAVIQ
jgi:hypothetical protein